MGRGSVVGRRSLEGTRGSQARLSNFARRSVVRPEAIKVFKQHESLLNVQQIQTSAAELCRHQAESEKDWDSA